jgi:hypothetical protein
MMSFFQIVQQKKYFFLLSSSFHCITPLRQLLTHSCRQIPQTPKMHSMNTNISRNSPIIVTSNSEPGSSASIIEASPDAVLLPDAILQAGPVRPIGKKKLSFLHETRNGKKVIALFESPLMDVVYPVQVKESKFAAGGAINSATSPNFNDGSSETISANAATAIANTTASAIAATASQQQTGGSGGGGANRNTHWCNAVLRCSDEHSLAAITLLDTLIDAAYPASLGMNGPRKIQSDSILFASKDDPTATNMIKLDVPFDTNTLTLNVNVTDENGEPMQAVDVIPANSRIKAMFVVELTRTEQPARLFSRLTLIGLAIEESSSGLQQLRESCFFQTVPAINAKRAREQAALTTEVVEKKVKVEEPVHPPPPESLVVEETAATSAEQ